MTFFSRLKILWMGFWSSVIGDRESRNATLVAQGALEQQKRNLTRVREALTNLIFQRKKLQDQLVLVEREAAELKEDIQQAALEDRDELACNLIAKLEATEEEYRFLKEQIDSLAQDIHMARETETQLQREIVQYEQVIGSLASRYQALKVRRELQQQLQTLTRSVHATGRPMMGPMADQIRRLEAEMEACKARRQDWENEWAKMRERRAESRHKDALQRIKENLKRPDRALPVVIAEPVG